MRTKGIRQAEGESPYTVKTKGAIWWKEGDLTEPFSSHLSSWDLSQEPCGCTIRAHGDQRSSWLFNLGAEPGSD